MKMGTLHTELTELMDEALQLGARSSDDVVAYIMTYSQQPNLSVFLVVEFVEDKMREFI